MLTRLFLVYPVNLSNWRCNVARVVIVAIFVTYQLVLVAARVIRSEVRWRVITGSQVIARIDALSNSLTITDGVLRRQRHREAIIVSVLTRVIRQYMFNLCV